MRIAITGAHNVGKTTLAEALLEHLPGYTLEIEPYHQLRTDFAEVPTAEDFLEQFNYSVDLIYGSGDNVIFDRCVVDILAYLHVIDPQRNIEALFEKMQAVMGEVDLVVFVPVEQPDIMSAGQVELPRLRGQVDDLLHDWINDLNAKVIEVSGSVSNRRDQVLARLLLSL
ncbi:ATP-binding protein [Chitinophaga sp. sic0106]|nr:ATP-binding protein [Chitinophaga sp. sic0106]